MTGIIDTHAHPHVKPYTADRDEVLARARAAGVTTMIVVGTDPEGNRAAVDLVRTRRDYDLWATVGFHPHDAQDVTADDWDELEILAGDPQVVALGEMGFDFYRNISPPDIQEDVFRRQLDLAAKLDMPVVIHSRDAQPGTWSVLEPWLRARRLAGGTEPFGVMHCYAYGPEAALRYVEAGFIISVPGTVTYPKNAQGQAVARVVPDDGLVLETDCPYLTPQSRRGKRNEPAYIVETLEKVAELRGAPVAQIAAATTRTARRLFRLPASEGTR